MKAETVKGRSKKGEGRKEKGERKEGMWAGPGLEKDDVIGYFPLVDMPRQAGTCEQAGSSDPNAWYRIL